MKQFRVLLPVIAGLAACSRPTPQPPVSVVLTGASVPTAELDDAAIATIAVSIARGQTSRAEAAGREAQDPRVVALAKQIVADAPATTVESMDLAPRASILADEVASATDGDLGLLGTQQGGPTFDRAFVNAERRSLADSIQLLDTTLIPTAANTQLREALAQMRSTLARELDDARTLLEALPPAPKSATPP